MLWRLPSTWATTRFAASCLPAAMDCIRGMQVCAPGKTIQVPVGEQTLGRMFNVLGQPIDGGEPIPEDAQR